MSTKNVTGVRKFGWSEYQKTLKRSHTRELACLIWGRRIYLQPLKE